MYKFIKEQLRKEYIKPLKLLQIAPMFFVEKEWKKANGIELSVFK